MKFYQKPLLASYDASAILSKIGPTQTASLEFEVWRTSQLNQHQKQYQIVKIVERPAINANNKYYKIV